MMNANGFLSEQCKIVTGLPPIAPSTSTPDYVSMKGYNKLTVLISANPATGPITGSAISFLQATNVANAAGKALAFSTARRTLDVNNTDTLSDFTVSSNTFTTNATNAIASLYEVTFDESQLDIANGFDCVRCVTGNSVNATVSVVYILWPAKFGGSSPVPSAIVD